jgi:hypothetical protein
MGVGMAVAFPSGGSHKNGKVNLWGSNASIADTERDGKVEERSGGNHPDTQTTT